VDASIPLFRLEDTGMGLQMQEYAVSQVLHWFRRFDDYQALKNQAKWQPLPEYTREEFTVGIMGAGVLGAKVAESLQAWGFPLRCWSRSRKSWSGVESFAGTEELGAFLSQTRVLINLLPNTAETVGIINADLLSQLLDGAYVLNLARGVHLNEDDLLASLDSGKVKGAMLDVYSREPLPEDQSSVETSACGNDAAYCRGNAPGGGGGLYSRTILDLEVGNPLRVRSIAFGDTNANPADAGFFIKNGGDTCYP
jgi:glyoxylate/hydroxypyruvate reductase A